MTKYSVSVVIPAYNCQKTITNVLESILNQDYPTKEVIVVDDGSTDDTATLVKKISNVKYLYQQNAGPAAARNCGARESSGEIVFFTDSDCLPRHNWISTSLIGFRDSSVGTVAGSYGIANPEPILSRVIHQEILFRHRHLMPDYPKAFGSYNVAIRRDVFMSVGGFNEFYRRASGEDNDLSYKILKAGYKIFFERTSLVDHFHTEDLAKYLKEQFRHGVWRVKMYVDHPRMTLGDDYTFWKDIVEPPLCLLSLLGIILCIFSFKLIMLTVFAWGALLLLEVFYSLMINRTFSERIFAVLMMFTRAFSRTFGFSTGFFLFFLKKYFKKSK